MAASVTYETDLNPKTVLCVGAHADDIDFCMAGTVAKWAAGGADIYYLVLTNGNRGSADPHTDTEALRGRRRDEQTKAARVAGAKEVFFCDYDDCRLTVDDEVRRDIVRIIRRVNPDVVMTMDPTMIYDAPHGIINHPDHRAAGQATLDAVYPMARDHLSFPELEADGLRPHITPTVLLYNSVTANYAIDVTETLERKLAALAEHTSQFPDIASMQERVRLLAEDAGGTIGVRYAEPYMRIDIA